MSRTTERILMLSAFAIVIALLVWRPSDPSVAEDNAEPPDRHLAGAGDDGPGDLRPENPPDAPEDPPGDRAADPPVDTPPEVPRFMRPGALEAGSGDGLVDQINYGPTMRFPIEKAPAYANSQVYRPGGFRGPPGGQCDPVNYSYAWWDNYCETRGHATPLCPAGRGHQGQDIRPATCERNVHWAVAAEAGTITSIGSYSVRLMTDSGVRFTYLHLQRSTLAVREGDRVQRGQRIGLVSNEFGGTPTTVHLHFEIRVAVAAGDIILNTHVPPYLALVDSYVRLLAGGA
jgi:murein DD-endopeptidase MepM/ murein hydrolase activator NlpD